MASKTDTAAARRLAAALARMGCAVTHSQALTALAEATGARNRHAPATEAAEAAAQPGGDMAALVDQLVADGIDVVFSKAGDRVACRLVMTSENDPDRSRWLPGGTRATTVALASVDVDQTAADALARAVRIREDKPEHVLRTSTTTGSGPRFVVDDATGRDLDDVLRMARSRGAGNPCRWQLVDAKANRIVAQGDEDGSEPAGRLPKRTRPRDGVLTAEMLRMAQAEGLQLRSDRHGGHAMLTLTKEFPNDPVDPLPGSPPSHPVTIASLATTAPTEASFAQLLAKRRDACRYILRVSHAVDARTDFVAHGLARADEADRKRKVHSAIACMTPGAQMRWQLVRAADNAIVASGDQHGVTSGEIPDHGLAPWPEEADGE